MTEVLYKEHYGKKKSKNSPKEIEFTVESGNVYADFGLPNPEEAKKKQSLRLIQKQAVEFRNSYNSLSLIRLDK